MDTPDYEKEQVTRHESPRFLALVAERGYIEPPLRLVTSEGGTPKREWKRQGPVVAYRVECALVEK